MKDTRMVKIQFIQSGTGKGARINLSMPFLREHLGVAEYSRNVVVVYDDERKEIVIKKAMFELEKKGHTKPSRLLIAQAKDRINAIKSFEGVADLYEYYKNRYTKETINDISNKTRKMVDIHYYNSCDILGNILDDKDYAQIKEALFNYNFDLSDMEVRHKHLLKYFRDELKHYDKLDKETIKDIVDTMLNTLYYEATQENNRDLNYKELELIERIKEKAKESKYKIKTTGNLVLNNKNYDDVESYLKDYSLDLTIGYFNSDIGYLGYWSDVLIENLDDDYDYKVLIGKIKAGAKIPRIKENIFFLIELYNRLILTSNFLHKDFDEVVNKKTCLEIIKELGEYYNSLARIELN
jgi:hypothetical protein